jgi:very-short-patch-repair endonuclease
MRDVSALARKAASQFGLLTSSDLRRLSFSEPSIASLVGQGILKRLRRGLFVFGALDGRWEQELMRACLASARRGVVSHRSAQRLWDLRPWETVVEVTVRGGNAPRLEGAVVHRTWDLEPADVTSVRNLPVTSVARTLCDAGVHHREPEAHLLQLLVRHGLPEPVAQFPVVAGGERFVIDLAYPDARVLLEYDGFLPHISPRQFARDRRRQNLLMLAGWLVLRFSNTDLRDRPVWVAAQVRRAVDHHSA